MLPRQGKAKGVHHHQALILWNVIGTYLRTRKISKMPTVKWQQTHNYQQPNLKKQKEKEKQSKQLEQEQNHRNRDHMEGCLLYTSDAADE